MLSANWDLVCFITSTGVVSGGDDYLMLVTHILTGGVISITGLGHRLIFRRPDF